jgi:hypothetical protein
MSCAMFRLLRSRVSTASIILDVRPADKEYGIKSDQPYLFSIKGVILQATKQRPTMHIITGDPERIALLLLYKSAQGLLMSFVWRQT